MLLKNAFKIGVLIVPLMTYATPLPRVGKLVMKRDEVIRINVASGRSTIVKFQCNIMSFSVGPTNDIEAYLNERNSQILEVSQGRPDSQPAGLKVFCNDEFFVFDIIPTNAEHQDYVEVSGRYGALKTVRSKSLPLATNVKAKEKSPGKHERYKTKKILASSKGE